MYVTVLPGSISHQWGTPAADEAISPAERRTAFAPTIFPPPNSPDPGLRLLPEYDGLLVGYHGRHRTRFLTEQQLPKVWAKVNGLFSPVVLHDGQLVASWKTITKGRSTNLEVTMLDPHPVLADDLFEDAIAATEQVLGIKITELRVRPPLR